MDYHINELLPLADKKYDQYFNNFPMITIENIDQFRQSYKQYFQELIESIGIKDFDISRLDTILNSNLCGKKLEDCFMTIIMNTLSLPK